MKKLPQRAFAIINGDDGKILAWCTTRAAAKRELRAYNECEGYEPNCTIAEYELRHG